MNVGDQRVFHLTHISNLGAILDAGELVAGSRPPVDLSSELTRELRATAELVSGSRVSQHVPFFLTANATVWEDLRRGIPDPRWSLAALRADPYDFVWLVTTMRALGDGAVMTDGDAAGIYTRFAESSVDVSRMLVRVRADEDALPRAEVLVHGSVPFDAVSIIGVANDRVRERVREILSDAGVSTKVAVYPPWFQAPA